MSKILLGLGGNVDVEVVWDAERLAALAAEHEIGSDELDTGIVIDDERSLLISILAMVRQGSGGERYVSDRKVFESFLTGFDTRTTLGGTGVRAALTLHSLGLASTVHLVSNNPVIRRLLPSSVERIGSPGEDPVHPHLIVQYPAGATVRLRDAEIIADRANRLIYVNDPANRDMVLSTELDMIAPELGILLLCGFNSMRDRRLLDDRLDQISQVVAAMSDDALVVFEDAGQHVPMLGARVHEVMSELADVISMNEDELSGHLGRPVDLLDAGVVERALRDGRQRIGATILVVHTQHWAAAIGPGSAGLRTALRCGMITGGTRYLIGDAPDPDDYRRIAALPDQPAGAALATELEDRLGCDAACVPALDVETATPTTIGLGDSFVGGMVASLAQDRLGLTAAPPG